MGSKPREASVPKKTPDSSSTKEIKKQNNSLKSIKSSTEPTETLNSTQSDKN